MTLMKWHAEGKLKPHIHKIVPLEDAKEALEEMMNRSVKGKMVVQI